MTRTSTAVHPRMDGSAPRPASSLTPRQWQVLRLLAEGWTQKEVGAELGISPNTVRNHMTAAYRTLRIDTSPSAASLVGAFRALGWLQVPAATWTVAA